MAKKKTTKGKKTKNTDAPKMIAAKGGLSQSELLDRVLATMDEENWISKKVGRDFIASLKAVVEDEISEGHPVRLFGITKITPRYHTAGQREVNSEFGNPDSPKVTKKYKPKVSLLMGKPQLITKALPTPQKMAKVVGK